jgi:hypothetical protein
MIHRDESILHIPDAIRRIADSGDRKLAWQFFIFFSRFEYALKKDSRYLKSGTGDAQPNWDSFASNNAKFFMVNASSSLADAVNYFKTKPPRKQLCINGEMTWSDPVQYNESEPLLVWLLRVIRIVRNNQFHGGKFARLPIPEPSRDQDLLANTITILDSCLNLDHSIRNKFFNEIDE